MSFQLNFLLFSCVTFYWKVMNGFNILTQRGKSVRAEVVPPLKGWRMFRATNI